MCISAIRRALLKAFPKDFSMTRGEMEWCGQWFKALDNGGTSRIWFLGERNYWEWSADEWRVWPVNAWVEREEHRRRSKGIVFFAFFFSLMVISIEMCLFRTLVFCDESVFVLFFFFFFWSEQYYSSVLTDGKYCLKYFSNSVLFLHIFKMVPHLRIVLNRDFNWCK